MAYAFVAERTTGHTNGAVAATVAVEWEIATRWNAGDLIGYYQHGAAFLIEFTRRYTHIVRVQGVVKLQWSPSAGSDLISASFAACLAACMWRLAIDCIEYNI
jgi:hypothetical protein